MYEQHRLRPDLVAPPREFYCNGCNKWFELQTNYWGDFSFPPHDDGWHAYTGGQPKPCIGSCFSFGSVVAGIKSRIIPHGACSGKECMDLERAEKGITVQR